MTDVRPLSPIDLLGELEPVLARNFDRHLASTGEWFPHEYVPYELGRNFELEPWKPQDSGLSDIGRVALEVNLLTEDNLPYYHLNLWDAFRRNEAWGEWLRRWTAEEGRHSIVLRDYLTVTRGADPREVERGRMQMVQLGYDPEWSRLGPLDTVVFTTFQELATRISHRNTGELTRDPIARRITQRIATDENLHYVFYRDMAAAACELDPSSMVLAIRRQVRDFAMPGADMPEFRAKAKAMAAAGVYNFRIHHDQVLLPVLTNHWRIEHLDGLTDEAKQAREDVFAHLDKLDRVASRLDELGAPVLGVEAEAEPEAERAPPATARR
ncbi:MAG: acyl-ACP desaturase [Actinomycetota bacterium]